MIRQLAAKGLVALLFSASITIGSAGAEPVPLPKIDFEARAKLLNDGTLLIRHANGKMRIEMQLPQFKEPATGYIDLGRKRMILILPIPGIQDTALEVEFGDDAMFGQVMGEGVRKGQSSVAGEPCTIWSISSGNHKAEACLTSDNIALRTEADIDGKTRTVYEVTELKRQTQNPADLEPPANVRVMKLPKGLKGIPGLPL